MQYCIHMRVCAVWICSAKFTVFVESPFGAELLAVYIRRYVTVTLYATIHLVFPGLYYNDFCSTYISFSLLQQTRPKIVCTISWAKGLNCSYIFFGRVSSSLQVLLVTGSAALSVLLPRLASWQFLGFRGHSLFCELFQKPHTHIH